MEESFNNIVDGELVIDEDGEHGIEEPINVKQEAQDQDHGEHGLEEPCKVEIEVIDEENGGLEDWRTWQDRPTRGPDRTPRSTPYYFSEEQTSILQMRFNQVTNAINFYLCSNSIDMSCFFSSSFCQQITYKLTNSNKKKKQIK